MYKCGDCDAVFEELKVITESHGLNEPPFERFYVCPDCGGERILRSKSLPHPTAEGIFDKLIIPLTRINKCLESKVGESSPADTLGEVFGDLVSFLQQLCGDDGELDDNLYCVKNTEASIARCRDVFLRQMEGFAE